MLHPTQDTTETRPTRRRRGLATLRESAGVTPQALATTLGVALPAYLRMENGQDLRNSMVIAIAKALGVGVAEVALAAEADRRAR